MGLWIWYSILDKMMFSLVVYENVVLTSALESCSQRSNCVGAARGRLSNLLRSGNCRAYWPSGCSLPVVDSFLLKSNLKVPAGTSGGDKLFLLALWPVLDTPDTLERPEMLLQLLPTAEAASHRSLFLLLILSKLLAISDSCSLRSFWELVQLLLIFDCVCRDSYLS